MPYISKVILNGVTQMDVTGDTVASNNLLSGETATGADGAPVTGNIATKTSSNLTVSGATVTAPAGYYASAASKSVASGTAGTPVATKSAVSNHAVTVTPSVTNTAGYINGGTKSGTAVSVSASELVSGNKAITENDTNIDVTNYATVSVDVPTSTDFIITLSWNTQTLRWEPDCTFTEIQAAASAGKNIILTTNDNGATAVRGEYDDTYDPYLSYSVVEQNYTPPGSVVAGYAERNYIIDATGITDFGVAALVDRGLIVPTTITANGTYDAETYFNVGYNTVTVNVPTGGGGLEYETGTWTPENIAPRGYVPFANVHTSLPIYVSLVDEADEYDSTLNTGLMFYINIWGLYPGAGIWVDSSTVRYGLAGYIERQTSSTAVSAGYTYITLPLSSTSDTNPNAVRYWVNEAGFYPYGTTQANWKTNRTYKWIAVWAPST